MSRKIFTGILSMLAVISVSAQETPKNKDKKEKEEIIIRNKKEGNEKMTIVIDGDRITINGKPVTEYKGDNIIIRHKDLEDLRELGEENIERLHEDIARMQNDLHREMAPRLRELERMKISRYPGPGSDNFDFDFNFDGVPEMNGVFESKPRTQLGVSMEKAEKGVKVTEVVSGSAASKAGLKDGDIITKFNGKPVMEPENLASMVREKKAGDEVEIAYLPAGQKKEKKIKVKLGETKNDIQAFNFRVPAPLVSPVPRNYPMPPMAPMSPEWKEFNEDFLREAPRGQYFRFENRGPMFGIKIQDTEDSSGVKVLDVDEGSLASNAGVKENDIITQIDGKQVKDTDDAREALQATRAKNQYNVSLKRNGSPITVQVKVPVKLKKASL
jgi:serine protease Do